MPVPKKKRSKSRNGMRFSHKAITAKNTIVCPNCGDSVLRHRVCGSCGYYKKKAVVQKD